ncbi:MAG TPA: FlgD immunoglobulin-like domain containing protein [Candidatus Krumholzibacteria bacterium]|nr:FlgD immunoglobulin-like domain containing protein [Candidatus Krumholzibacteria bacterium]
MLKLDGATGEVLWSLFYAGPDGLDEAPLAVAADADGEVYVAGRGNLPNQAIDMLAMRLDAGDGHIVWMDHLHTAAGRDDIAWDLVIGEGGDPVITGVALDAAGAAVGVTRRLAAADGAVVWTATTTGVLNEFTTRGAWLARLDDGDLAVCQRGYGSNGYDVLLARLAPGNGAARWSVRYDGPTHGGDLPRGMIRDAAGDLLVAGVQDAWWNYNFMLLKFNGTTGGLAWQAPGYDGPPGWYDAGTALVVGPDGDPVVTGLSDGSGTGWDIATVGYDADTGAIAWSVRHDGAASQSDEPRAVVAGTQGDLFVTGYGYGVGTGKDHLTLRYTLPATSAAPVPTLAARLEGARPNPFNPSTTVAFTLDRTQDARLAVYGLDGRLVRELAAGTFPAGRHEVRWDGTTRTGQAAASGAYLLVLDTPGGRAAARATLLK